MDTSKAEEMVAYIVNGHVVDGNLLKPENCLSVVEAVTEVYRPYYKYLPYVSGEDLRKIQEQLELVSGKRMFHKEEKPRQVIFHGNLNSQTRLLPMGPCNPFREFLAGNLIYCETSLLFEPEWEEWIKLERVLVGNRLFRNITVVSTDSLTFGVITRPQLVELVGTNQSTWRMITRSLRKLAQMAIQRKQDHINSLTRAIGKAIYITERVRISAQ